MSSNAGISKAISFSVVLIGIAVFYYYVVFLPNQEQTKLDFQKQQEQTAEYNARVNNTLLQACLDKAEKNYNAEWEIGCNTEKLKNDCNLPLYLADNIKKDRNDAKDFCFKQYPQK
jgi:hypothetical protein